MYMDRESVYKSTSAVKQTSETLRKKINIYGTFVLSLLTSFIVVIMVSKRVTLYWRKTAFGQSIWSADDQLTTAFTILNCLGHEFLKGFLVQGRQFWKFSILSNFLDLQWCLPNKLKIHSQLSVKTVKTTTTDTLIKLFIHSFILAEMAKVASSVARPRKCYVNRLERFM